MLELIEKSKQTKKQGNSIPIPQKGKPFTKKTFISNKTFQDKSGKEEQDLADQKCSPQDTAQHTPQNPKDSTIPKDSEYIKSIFLTSSIDNNFLLFTAQISASPHTPLHQYIRGFFDSGSPKSYIQTSKAIKELNLSPTQQHTICIQGVGEQKSAPQISQEVTFYLHTHTPHHHSKLLQQHYQS